MRKEIIIYISDVLVCGCIGVIIDTLVDTSFTFTAIGLVVGVALAVILKNKKGKEE